MNNADKVKFEKLYEKLGKLEREKNSVTAQLCGILSEKLGDGWGVDTNPVDGVIVFDLDANNYSVSNLAEILKLPRDEAIAIIQETRCD